MSEPPVATAPAPLPPPAAARPAGSVTWGRGWSPEVRARKIKALVPEFPWQRTTASHVQRVKRSQPLRSGAGLRDLERDNEPRRASVSPSIHWHVRTHLRGLLGGFMMNTKSQTLSPASAPSTCSQHSTSEARHRVPSPSRTALPARPTQRCTGAPGTQQGLGKGQLSRKPISHHYLKRMKNPPSRRNAAATGHRHLGREGEHSGSCPGARPAAERSGAGPFEDRESGAGPGGLGKISRRRQ